MSRQPSVSIWRVARQCGVILRDAKDHSPTSVRPKQCFCKPTLRAIGQAHGEEHLALVLRLIVESEGNAAELHAGTIKAVSALVISGIVPVDSALFEAFDRIDLAQLRKWCQAVRPLGASVNDAMATALAWQVASPARLLERMAA